MDVAFDLFRALGLALAAGVLIALVPSRRVADAAALLAGAALGLWMVLGDRDGWWWAAVLTGVAGGLLAASAAGGLFARVRARLADAGAGGVILYAIIAALVIAGATLLFPPLALLAGAALGWLLYTGRRREGEKYAGLRILR